MILIDIYTHINIDIYTHTHKYRYIHTYINIDIYTQIHIYTFTKHIISSKHRDCIHTTFSPEESSALVFIYNRDAKVPEKSGFPDFSSQLKIFPDFLFMTVMV